MKNEFFKKDLITVLVLTAIFVVALILIRSWDQQSGILESIAEKYF